jgi:hypothetical protein
MTVPAPIESYTFSRALERAMPTSLLQRISLFLAHSGADLMHRHVRNRRKLTRHRHPITHQKLAMTPGGDGRQRVPGGIVPRRREHKATATVSTIACVAGRRGKRIPPLPDPAPARRAEHEGKHRQSLSRRSPIATRQFKRDNRAQLRPAPRPIASKKAPARRSHCSGADPPARVDWHIAEKARILGRRMPGSNVG